MMTLPKDRKPIANNDDSMSSRTAASLRTWRTAREMAQRQRAFALESPRQTRGCASRVRTSAVAAARRCDLARAAENRPMRQNRRTSALERLWFAASAALSVTAQRTAGKIARQPRSHRAPLVSAGAREGRSLRPSPAVRQKMSPR
jgi:hypothetical protein